MIAGVPYVVPIVLVLLVAGTFVLDRTRFGRHVYAVGGNREAARRAGIDVVRIRAAVFVIASALAAIGAIVYSSKVGFGLAERGWRQHAAVRGRRRGDRRHVAVRRPGPGQQRGDRWRGAGDRGERARACSGSPPSVVFVVTGLVLLLAAGVDVLSRRRSAVAGR